MEQGSRAWQEWRKRGIGASLAPVIMGVSPYETPHHAWERFTGREPWDNGTNWAQARGNNLEPVARAEYELLNSVEMPPILAQHEEYDFLRASLDGYDADSGVILEIKCPGKVDHKTAKEGKIPEKYIPQLAHQLLVTGAVRVDYFSFDGKAGVTVPYYPDVSYTKSLLKALKSFWNCVKTDTPPPLTDKDFKKVRDKDLSFLINRWKEQKGRLDDIAKNEASLRKQIIEKLKHPRVICAGAKIQKIMRKGSVDYKKVPELNGVDLEPYRKAGSESWRFDVDS